MHANLIFTNSGPHLCKIGENTRFEIHLRLKLVTDTCTILNQDGKAVA